MQYNEGMPRRYFFVLLVLLVFLPTPSLADVTVRIGATPQYPSPNQQVTLTARSIAEKGVYTYFWTVNGTLLTEGVDLDTVTIFAGRNGAETNVDVALVDINGNIAGTDSYALLPGSVDVVWEGRTYTPPFYRGKPYPTGDSQIVLQAIPHLMQSGAEIPANQLVYSWDIDGEKPRALSGYGKSAVTITPASFRHSTIVSVTAQTRDGSYAARTSTEIPTVTPQIVVYEDAPLGGIKLYRAMPSTVTFVGDEMTFWAAPFFVIDPGAMTFAWTLNDTPFALDQADPSSATFRKTGPGGGIFSVGVSVQRTGHIFEQAARIFNLSFDE